MISTTDPDYEIQVLRWSPIDGEYEGSGLNVLSDTGKIMDEALATSYEVFTEFTACLSEDDYEEVSYDYDSYGDYSCRSGIGYVTLLTHPCMDSARDSSSPEACAAVCTDPERLFGSWTTLWTCLTLASMSLAVEKFKGDGDGLHNNITSFVQSVAEPGVNITTFDGREVLSATHRCAMASCSQNSVGNCFTDFDSEAEKFFGNDSDDWSFLNSTYCYGVEGSINVDVAGPGVVISYLLQSSLALYAWAIIMFLSLESTTSVLAKPYLYFLRYSRGRKYTVASLFPRTARIFRRIEDCNFLHSTAAFITDFHEAQCFFTFATSIALLYGQQQTADFNGADSWQSLMTNRDIISGLILSGATPIILTQLTLHRLSISSIYSLTCSTLALIMSGVTATQLKEYNVDKAHRMFADVEGPEDCGRHPSLRTFCLKGSPSIYPTQLSQGSAAMMIFLWLVPLVGLWYLRVVSLLSNPPGRGPWWLKRAMPLKEMFALSRRATASEWAKDFISLIPRLCKMVKLVMNVGVLAAHVIIVYLVSCNFESLNASLMDVSVKENGWNAGQVIAMLLWVPVLAKYLYTILFGMERGFAIRLSNAFTILKKTGKEQEKGHSLDGETKQLQHSSLVSKTSGNYSSVYSTDMSVNDLGDPDDRSARDRQSV